MRCNEGKRAYPSLESADQAILNITRQWGEDDPLLENLEAYECRHCGLWHLGHRGGKSSGQRLLEDIRRIRYKRGDFW